MSVLPKLTTGLIQFLSKSSKQFCRQRQFHSMPTIRAYNTATVKQCVIPMEGQSNGKKWRTYKKTLSWFLIRALVQLLIHVWLFVTPKTAAHQASLSFTISYRLLKLMFIESVMPSNHLILCHPIPLLPSIFPSIRVFSNESVFCIRWPKYWSFNFSICPSNEYSDWFPLGWTDLISLQSKQLSRVSPTPQFRSISSSVHSFLHSPTLTSIHNYWKKP